MISVFFILANMNNSTFELCEPPEHLLSDYGEMMFLALCIAVGTPLNLYVLAKLLRQYELVNSVHSK